MASLEERVISVVVDKLKVEESDVVSDASFTEDLYADSLDLVELIMGFEEEFDVEISDEAAEEITTVGMAIDHLKNEGVE